jgi:hypothetical protein
MFEVRSEESFGAILPERPTEVPKCRQKCRLQLGTLSALRSLSHSRHPCPTALALLANLMAGNRADDH